MQPTCHLLCLNVQLRLDVLGVYEVHILTGSSIDTFTLIQYIGCIILILGHFLEILLVVFVIVRGTL